ncbi:hypothetical protein [Oerskovia paurometabola]|uniref:hypothetical protein n=1 Tax=Oerskovia paurometabola TaxID=162170 RepID=UPI0038051703
MTDERTSYEQARDRAQSTIDRAHSSSRPAFDERGRSAGTQWPNLESIAIAQSILALAEAIRPAPVEVSVKVDVDEDQITQAVRNVVEGGRA